MSFTSQRDGARMPAPTSAAVAAVAAIPARSPRTTLENTAIGADSTPAETRQTAFSARLKNSAGATVATVAACDPHVGES